MCEGEREESGWGSCDPTAPRPASQAGETQANLGAHPLRATGWWWPARAEFSQAEWKTQALETVLLVRGEAGGKEGTNTC